MGKQERTQKYDRREHFFISGTNYLHSCDTVIEAFVMMLVPLARGVVGFCFVFQ